MKVAELKEKFDTAPLGSITEQEISEFTDLLLCFDDDLSLS